MVPGQVYLYMAAVTRPYPHTITSLQSAFIASHSAKSINDWQTHFEASYAMQGSIWAVKVSVNLLHIALAKKLPHLYPCAVRTMYVVIFCWVVVYTTLPFGCFPTSRRWEGPLGFAKPCLPILKLWDFWLHNALHVSSDIWLCILPWLALIQISERRLLIAVGCVYGLAIISIIVSVLRLALFAADVKRNLKFRMLLIMVKLVTLNALGCLPGISSMFTREYLHYSTRTISEGNKANRLCGSSNYSELVESGKSSLTPPIEMQGQTNEMVVATAYSEAQSSKNGSTDNILSPIQTAKTTIVNVTAV
ncbi:hypothetical protein K469DRAFT_687070 [Zopfia rhizophila CBS 207.26]|uniref:Rhodopsin domain-containing protein n=1 Tax=Zopfia rhizophila CBS 207.26 TaxID=1314779 RepID=A0A6A6E7G4_9PEZI|nr:hypothetical protein K469DRAFT_687070 [Zopfia rhizophila CBS 207.26]